MAKQNIEMNTAPPIGIEPERSHIEVRARGLYMAIARYLDADLKPLDAWWAELNHLIQRYKEITGNDLITILIGRAY